MLGLYCEQHPAMKRAIKALSRTLEEGEESGAAETASELLILSNSNTMFIELVLRHHGLWARFDGAVITNPARWDPENADRLLLRRRVDAQESQHGCTLGCSANMCKAAKLIAYLERRGPSKLFDRIAYVGDGDNDYCPISRVLKFGDVALVRSRRELARQIEAKTAKGNALSCWVMLWEGAWEVEQIFLNTLLKAP
ncbi:hypothetical protein PtB15_10B305 [Puccinia triticina]|nr:hypothetical protein PtB15_10B305 [Puccinia triticina]